MIIIEKQTSEKVSFLLQNSNLPGPRGNLELLYSFSKTATQPEIEECLTYLNDDVKNSPEEFVTMCGIVGYAIHHQQNLSETMQALRGWSSHKSWRIREAVAIAIQEIAVNKVEKVIPLLQPWLDGNALEKRAVIAALCEPKLLKEKQIVVDVLEILSQVTSGLQTLPDKADETHKSLMKTLGYGWSVAIVANPETGKVKFEKIIALNNKHIRWIVKENLNKNRLLRMDKEWVDNLASEI